MISCDTNILFYSINTEASEHSQAASFLEKHLQNKNFFICELALVELYVLLRNPVACKKALSASQATEVIQYLRKNPHWTLVDYQNSLTDELWKLVSNPNFPYKKIYDARLALTLRHHGVTEFATRNPKDFQKFGFKKVFNPID